MGLFGRLRQGRRSGSAQDRQRVREAVERIVNLHPHLRLARRYQSRLEPAVEASLKYVSDIVDSVPAPHQINTAAWSSDPYIHAFFVAPGDIAPALSRSADLRAFIEAHAGLTEAYAVLGMAMAERHRLGVALEGETMRRDVVQETVNFSDHQVRMCGCTEADLRQEIVRRLVDQLGLEGLARIAQDKSRRDVLEQERALLKTRLQLLERQGVGMRSVLGGEAAESQELASLQEQIKENEQNLHSLGIRSEALERELDRLCEVLANPSQHIYVSSKRFRLDRMNVVLPETGTQEGADVTFQIARIPTTPPQMRAFALIRFACADLLPSTNLLDEATRLLR